MPLPATPEERAVAMQIRDPKTGRFRPPSPHNRTRADLPMAECPHCGKTFQWHDYYNVDVGDTTECPACEQTIHVVFRDTCIIVELSTEPEP